MAPFLRGVVVDRPKDVLLIIASVVELVCAFASPPIMASPSSPGAPGAITTGLFRSVIPRLPNEYRGKEGKRRDQIL